MSTIKISYASEIKEDSKTILKEHGYSLIKKNSIFGGDPIWTFIGTISITCIGSVTKIIIELIRAKSLVEVEIDGVKIKGVSEKNIKKILEKSCDDA